MRHEDVPKPDSHLLAVAELAMKHDMTIQMWRVISADGKRYKVMFSAGFHASAPCPCWAHVFPIDYPLDRAVDHLASHAWAYFVKVGYDIPDDGQGLTPRDIERTRTFRHAHPRLRGSGVIETVWATEDIPEDDVCGRYPDHHRSWAEHKAMLETLGLPIVKPDAPLNLEPRKQVRPTDPAVIFRLAEHGVELARLRWWLVPWFHRGTLKEWKLTTFNARAETLRTSRTFGDAFKRRRCLVSADGWYEWRAEHGPKAKKTMYLFEPRDGEPIMLAGIWDRADTADQGIVESFSIVTQPAGAPLNGYHDRAPVVLFQNDWKRWLDTAADVEDLLGPESVDRFRILRVDSESLL